jgi:hypothetical protein
MSGLLLMSTNSGSDHIMSLFSNGVGGCSPNGSAIALFITAPSFSNCRNTINLSEEYSEPRSGIGRGIEWSKMSRKQQRRLYVIVDGERNRDSEVLGHSQRLITGYWIERQRNRGWYS